MSRNRIKMVAIAASKQVCLLSMVVLLAAGISFGKPAVSLSRKSGPPTSKLLVSGSGYKPYAEIDIYFDTKDEAKAIANGSGSFSKISIEAVSYTHLDVYKRQGSQSTINNRRDSRRFPHSTVLFSGSRSPCFPSVRGPRLPPRGAARVPRGAQDRDGDLLSHHVAPVALFGQLSANASQGTTSK